MRTKITASEAVFGFAAWLTCRKNSIKIGAKYDAGIMAQLAEEWLKTNKLSAPRENIYPKNITQPKVS